MRSAWIYRIRKHAVDIIALVCAFFMLCVVPLLFRDAFFDINRVKVEAVIATVPVLLFAFGAALLVRPQQDGHCSAKKSIIVLMLTFLFSCVVSCALTGFENATLTGSEGRYCGLYFMLCCGAAFFMISMGDRRLLRFTAVSAMICAAVCAGLGFVNAMGMDPLGFYVRIQKGQETVFLSTIGHFDFYGTYLVILFPLAGAFYVFSDPRMLRYIGLVCTSVIAFGAMASRTDSAFAGLHLGCFMLLALAGGDYLRIARALSAWAMGFAALPLTYSLLQKSAFQLEFSGLPRIIFDLHAGEMAAALLIVLAGVCLLLHRRGSSAPGRKRWMVVLLLLFGLFAVAAGGVVFHFSVFDTSSSLGSASSFLRFNDHWGSLRGFAWIRSIRAYGDYPLLKKLFGSGMELTLRVLTPYFDNPDMLVYGVFNDPHCQPLQMLLTCGLFGMASFVLFYVSMLVLLFRYAEDDPVLCGVLGSVWSYSVIMLINVTQPILIATYFSICALGVACIRNDHLSGGVAA